MKAQVVVTYHHHLFNRFVRWWGIRWTHAAIRYREKGENWRVFETAAFGTVEKDWTSFIEDVDEYEVYETKKPLKEEEFIKLTSFAWGNVGKMYNYFRLVYIALKYLLAGPKPLNLSVTAHVCSSFTDTCFRFIGRDLVPTEDIWVTPDDLSESDKLKLVESKKMK
jgi:hypothetical protein